MCGAPGRVGRIDLHAANRIGITRHKNLLCVGQDKDNNPGGRSLYVGVPIGLDRASIGKSTIGIANLLT